MKAKIKELWDKYEHKIILAFGFILVAIVSFEAGVLRGKELKQNPIIIEKLSETLATNNASETSSGAQNSPPEAANTENSNSNIPSKCAFVGSKNSNKYHLPTCRWAKNIKSENLVCFSDENQAKSKGYLPDKNCIK